MNYALNLTSDTFNQFKHDFDSIIQGTIQTMEQKGSLDATIAVTFNICSGAISPFMSRPRASR